VAAHCCSYTTKKKLNKASEENGEEEEEEKDKKEKEDNEEEKEKRDGGKNENQKDQDALNESPLPNTDQIEIIRLLCKSGARVNSKDSKSLTALHYACRVNSKVGYNFFFLFFFDV
jgi:ankyrin repeat protein